MYAKTRCGTSEVKYRDGTGGSGRLASICFGGLSFAVLVKETLRAKREGDGEHITFNNQAAPVGAIYKKPFCRHNNVYSKAHGMTLS
jgi:hypothetical protein